MKNSAQDHFIFSGLSLCKIFQTETALKNPTPLNIAYLWSAMMITTFLNWGFDWLIFRFNAMLQLHDQGDIGPTIGTTVLSFYLAYAFHFLSEQPSALNLSPLTSPRFIYSTTLLLFFLEAMKLRGLKHR
ncbi:hypothetical protein QE443_003139 [Pantoea ananatis]|uniref:hypothetical protein n=1 Tax=Pantoea ananas TaxID=553 RepID=UPI00277FF520|nr:hypothetical protein [Pantoea ananatis]MDQ1226978.1 hypothetical protein [Pantoea ananatis]MDR6088849.1 hypothetical protein [Pantoea ananatis]